jgi:two-component system NtrC family response regulator
MKPTLLIVDDDENIRTQMKWALAEEYESVMAADRPSALTAMRAAADALVLLDLGLPPKPNDTEEGFLALSDIVAEHPLAKVIVITGQGDKENALQAIGAGAYDFLSKPIDTDELKVILKRAAYVAGLERDYRAAQQKLSGDSFEGMLGSSPQMQDVFKSIRKVATTDAPVLILGESGTGKEMAAVAIHNLSRKREGPFVAINCAAIPETLLESELFGHEKGSFTGAHAQRKGRIEMAEGGTLFLDEIGELPASLQVKLLRYLQEHRIERVGGRESIEVDARVITATNADLRKAMDARSFREDLYYRVAVVTLRMPPLREREGDTEMLARMFLKRFAAESNDKVTGFSPKTLKAIRAYAWPGNVRELENKVKRGVIMADGAQVKPDDIELGAVGGGYEGATLREAREDVERTLIRRVLQRNKGNVSRTAESLGVSRPTLYELMDKLAIERK